MKLVVVSDTGYKALIETEPDGDHWQVKSAAYIFRGVLSPFVVLKRGLSEPDAERYANALADAIKGEK